MRAKAKLYFPLTQKLALSYIFNRDTQARLYMVILFIDLRGQTGVVVAVAGFIFRAYHVLAQGSPSGERGLFMILIVRFAM